MNDSGTAIDRLQAEPGARPISPRGPRAAYVHVPFCAHRCGYCNFTLVAGRDDLVDDYLAALELELRSLGEPRGVDTLFIGGGTPTRLNERALARLLALARDWFPLAAGGEFSVEANPIDLNLALARQLSAAGVNRLSLGGQSFGAAKLRVLERDHTPDVLRQSLDVALATFPSVSLDLIFAVPGETLHTWLADLTSAIASGVQHVSTYGLTFERGALFWNRLAHGELSRAGEELERDLYLAAIDQLAAAGFTHYEVSSFAREAHQCRHNHAYWAGDEYFAAGPGAARYVDGWRAMNHRSTTTYIRRVLDGESPVAERERLAPMDRAREALVFGLRRLAGVERKAFAEKFGYDPAELAGAGIARHVELGLLEWDGDWLRLTRAGLLVSDSLWPELL